LTTPLIAIGCDSSKGRIDVEIRNNHGTVLFTGAFDDTPDDHASLRAQVEAVRIQFPESHLVVGIESTGGLERNWLALFRHEPAWQGILRVFRLNAASVHAFRKAQLHRAPGDAAAASDIARFLLEHCATRMPAVEAEAGPLAFYRTIRSLSEESTAASQRLQGLLVTAHPDLGRFCRYGLSQWMLALLERYPTAAELARARPATLDAIPHIDAERAAELVANAKRSVASMTDPATAAAIRLLVRRLRSTQQCIEDARAELLSLIRADPASPLAKAVDLLDGIPGIGSWSAACLACEIGEATRFAHAKAIIAWAGLDPVVEASGDERQDHGISHRGNAHVRALLFPLAMTGIQHNPVLKAFHQRLIAHGKTHLEALVAVMAKMLRIAHAILLSGKPFDPGHEAKRTEQARQAQQARATQPQPPAKPAQLKLNAPISRREASRRKKAAAPGAQVRDQSPRRKTERGPREPASIPAADAKG
jgi:transposase